MVSHFDKGEIRKLIDENISGFTDRTLEVEITPGCSFKPMKLLVSVFSLLTGEKTDIVKQPRIHSDGETRKKIEYDLGAPLGLEPVRSISILLLKFKT